MIKLRIPERAHNPSVTINPGITQVRASLDALPLANARESCVRIYDLLQPLNRAPLDLNVRTQIMAMILPLLEDLISSVRSTYLNMPLPLVEKQARNALIISKLQTELSYGYKIIVQELLEEQVATGAGTTKLPQAIYYAMSFLARQLLDAYALYAEEPPHIWLELNQLYLYAEKQQLHDIRLNPLNADDEPDPATIANTYRRIILLSLANPYHLMQGEAIKMYKRLTAWAPHCKIIPLGNNPVPEGKLFADLNMDAPPLYAPNTSSKVRPREGRLLEISDILALLTREIRLLTTQTKNAVHSNLAKRMERDMYFRWSESWGIRRERMSHRTPTETPTQVVCSLTLAHHFLSGESDFAPEEREEEIQGQDSLNLGSDSLSLIPEEHTPWKSEGNQPAVRTDNPRQSVFETSDGDSVKDIWIKVFATSTQAVEEFTASKKLDFEIYDCKVINTNQGGYGLVCPSRTNPPARTGELLAARNEDTDQGWSVGVIRWMKVAQDCINMGVRTIADDTRPVATKAVAGVGTGGEYFRAMIAPNLDPEKYPTTLITPAAIYDINSVVMLNLDDRILYAKLTRQLDSTTSFSQYQFDLVEPPERIKTTSINQEERRSSRLFK
jgi:hypothetical protein